VLDGQTVSCFSEVDKEIIWREDFCLLKFGGRTQNQPMQSSIQHHAGRPMAVVEAVEVDE
jgi:hypothetical protein